MSADQPVWYEATQQPAIDETVDVGYSGSDRSQTPDADEQPDWKKEFVTLLQKT